MAKPRLTMLTGKNQNGKSTVAKKLIAEEDRVVIVQPFSKNDYNAKPYASTRAFALAYREARPRTFRVRLMLENGEQLAELCRLLWAIAPVTLVLDETAMYIPNPSSVPMEFKYICQLGAHSGGNEAQKVRVIYIGQRPTNAPPVLRAELDDWYVFRLNRKKDRAVLCDDFGVDAETAEKAGSLPPYHFMHVDQFGVLSYGQTTKD